jgi:uncharacterized membrane protein
MAMMMAAALLMALQLWRALAILLAWQCLVMTDCW